VNKITLVAFDLAKRVFTVPSVGCIAEKCRLSSYLYRIASAVAPAVVCQKGHEIQSLTLRRAFILYLITSAILTTQAGAQTTGSTTTEAAPVVVGALYNLTGFQSGLDIPSSHGARLAVMQINRNGGVLGRTLRLVLEDGHSQPEALRAKTALLLKRYPSMTAFVGLSDTDMVLGAAPVAAESGRLFLTSGATSPRLPVQVPKYLFLACFGDNVQAAAAAEWAYGELSARTAAIVYDAAKDYTSLLQGYFRTRFEELGGRIVTVRRFTMQAELNGVTGGIGKPDLVFLSVAAPEDIIEGVRELRKAGYSGPVFGGDSFDAEKLWQRHAELGNVFFTTHAYLGKDSPDPRVAAFREVYTSAYPGSTPDAFAALGYDTVRLLAAAIARAKSAEPAAVLEALAGIERFEGVTGVIGYASGSRIPRKSVSILRVERGQLSLARQMMPAKVPPP
jgi:branched-chain amino acid transport system substrate-binding protein